MAKRFVLEKGGVAIMKKLTLIQTNDIHFKLVNPIGRTDVYPEAIGAKLFEIFELARTLHADGILIAGDIVDTPGVGNDAIRTLSKILRQSPCPIYTIAGQHDEYGHNPESLRRTPYGIFVDGLDVIRNVADEPAVFGIKAGFNVVISGRDYDHEADIAEDYYEPDKDSLPIGESVIIHLAHGTVLTERPIYDRYTLVSDIKTSADVLCVGDYHAGIGVQRIDNEKKTFVVNPGALARVKATEEEINRTVRVAVIEIGEDRQIDIGLVPLESAMPGEKVLSREHIEAETAKNEMMDEFISMLASEGDFKMLTEEELVEDISLRENIPDDVKLEALKRIAEAREALGVRA
jgi:exonuclease SbcD